MNNKLFYVKQIIMISISSYKHYPHSFNVLTYINS